MWSHLLRLRLKDGSEKWSSTALDNDSLSGPVLTKMILSLAFGDLQIKFSSDKDRTALLVPITIKHYLPNSTTSHTVWGSKPFVLWLELWSAHLKRHLQVAASLGFHCNTHDPLSPRHGRHWAPPHCKGKKNPQEAGREFKCCRGCRGIRTMQIILKNFAFMF